MKKLFFGILFSSSVFAYEGFHCVPSMRQTRLEVLRVGDKIQLLVINPSGYEFMPQFDSGASLYNLAFLKMQGEDLKILGDKFIIQWNASDCELDSEKFVVNCEAASVDRASLGLSTTKITEESKMGSYEKRRFRFSVDTGNIYFVNLEFFTQTCEKF